MPDHDSHRTPRYRCGSCHRTWSKPNYLYRSNQPSKQRIRGCPRASQLAFQFLPWSRSEKLTWRMEHDRRQALHWESISVAWGQRRWWQCCLFWGTWSLIGSSFIYSMSERLTRAVDEASTSLDQMRRPYLIVWEYWRSWRWDGVLHDVFWWLVSSVPRGRCVRARRCGEYVELVPETWASSYSLRKNQMRDRSCIIRGLLGVRHLGILFLLGIWDFKPHWAVILRKSRILFERWYLSTACRHGITFCTDFRFDNCVLRQVTREVIILDCLSTSWRILFRNQHTISLPCASSHRSRSTDLSLCLTSNFATMPRTEMSRMCPPSSPDSTAHPPHPQPIRSVHELDSPKYCTQIRQLWCARGLSSKDQIPALYDLSRLFPWVQLPYSQ